jgi:hypothetical protein
MQTECPANCNRRIYIKNDTGAPAPKRINFLNVVIQNVFRWKQETGMCAWFVFIGLSHSGVPDDSGFLTAYAVAAVQIITDDLKASCCFVTNVTLYQYTRFNTTERLDHLSLKLLVQTPNRNAEYSGWRSCVFPHPAGERDEAILYRDLLWESHWYLSQSSSLSDPPLVLACIIASFKSSITLSLRIPGEDR